MDDMDETKSNIDVNNKDNCLTLDITKEQNELLNKYGFHFNDKNGKIINIETDTPSSIHNESLPLSVVHEFIQSIFQKQFKMKKIEIKSNMENDVLSSNIFISPKYKDKKTLFLIITGFGKVNAGEWSTSICIKHNIFDGTALSFISYAYKRNWSVILFDTNGCDNYKYDEISEKSEIYEKIKLGSIHCVDVFDEYIANLCDMKKRKNNKNISLENIVILAHSAGGRNVTYLLEKRGDILQHYIKKIAFTDIKDPYQQINKIKSKKIAEIIKVIYKQCARNWIKTKEPLPLNQSIKKGKGKTVIDQFSAGHKEHKYTTSSALNAILSFFEEIVLK